MQLGYAIAGPPLWLLDWTINAIPTAGGSFGEDDVCKITLAWYDDKKSATTTGAFTSWLDDSQSDRGLSAFFADHKPSSSAAPTANLRHVVSSHYWDLKTGHYEHTYPRNRAPKIAKADWFLVWLLDLSNVPNALITAHATLDVKAA
jgi:hypothetical protein